MVGPIDPLFAIEKYKWRSDESHGSISNENPIIFSPQNEYFMEPDEIIIRYNFTFPPAALKWMLYPGSCRLSEQYLIQRT